MHQTTCRAFVAFLALGIAATACGRKASTLGPDVDGQEAPAPAALSLSVHLERLDGTHFVARIGATPGRGSSAIGDVSYALDPPPAGDTLWQPLPPQGVALTLARRDAQPYSLIARAAPASGLVSGFARARFTADQVVASAQILSPRPSAQLAVPTPTTFVVHWTGSDPEAPGGVPGSYLTRLVTATEIDPVNPGGITAARVQEFFADLLANDRAGWTETAVTAREISGVTPSTTYYFAVSAADVGGEPGAHEAFFDRDRNVLAFRPTTDVLGPRLTVFNALFLRTMSTFTLEPTLELPLAEGQTMPFNWFGTPLVGSQVDAYRWALDIVDPFDEAPRGGPDDTAHWSDWSLETTSATVGPFPLVAGPAGQHSFYVMCRDDLGRVSMMVIRILPQPFKPAADLLVVDDLYGTPTESPTRYLGPYPMEAEQDSFYFAAGGFPDSLRIAAEGNPSAISEPGVFAGYECDTLDYRFWPAAGIPEPTKYRAVAWYTDASSAARAGSKFGSVIPMTALREINSVNRINTLAAYVQAGGKLWLFGEGATTAIANGYWSRIGGVPPIPYTSGDDPQADVLFPGNFLFDYCHLRSELNVAGNTAGTQPSQQLQSCIPYLPEFRCAEGTTPPLSGRTCDPRIGPGAEQTALRWTGLPQLTLRSYRGANPDPLLRSIARTWVITQPLHVTEGASDESVADTLYLCAARVYDPEHAFVPASDGFPNAIHYHGSAHGEVVWMGFPLHYFEREQAIQVAHKVLGVFGIAPLPGGATRGPGSAHEATGPLAAGNGSEDPIRRTARR